MPLDPGFVDHVLKRLAPFGPFRTNRCFGGLGISLGSVRVALVMGTRLYVAVDDTTRPAYERAGMSPLSYLAKQGRVELPRYYELPADVLADERQLRIWMNDAIGVADRPKPSMKAEKVRAQPKERSPGRRGR
jgi:DNA transformation protein